MARTLEEKFRFRHYGKDKVTMDFAFFAIAFNLKKMCRKISKQANTGGDSPNNGLFSYFPKNYPFRMEYLKKALKNQPKFLQENGFFRGRF